VARKFIFGYGLLPISLRYMLQYTGSLVTLAAVDIEKMVLFYSRFLGQEPATYIPNYAEFRLSGLRLGIFRPREPDQQEFQNAKGGMSLCLEVSNLEAAIAALTNLGYPPPGKIITAFHGREIYAYDPAINRLILYQSSE